MGAVLGWILFGFVVGLIARALTPGREPLGLIGTTLLGILGALIGGWIGQALGWYRADQGAGFIAATGGAILILAIYHMFKTRRSGRQPESKTESKTGESRRDKAA